MSANGDIINADLLRLRLDESRQLHAQAVQHIDELVGRCCELEAELRLLRTIKDAYVTAAIQLDEELEHSESNVRALLTANEELQLTVKGLCREHRPFIVAKGAPWTH